MRYIVILAGGSGTRLWPLSRRHAPKQVHALLDDETLLEKTYRRVRERFPPERIFVSTFAGFIATVRAQLPELPVDQCIVEPIARSTAAAIGYAALRLRARDPRAVFTTVNADAYVADVPAYLDAVDRAQDVLDASNASSVIVGVLPTYPETGYGYIAIAGDPPRASTESSKVSSGALQWEVLHPYPVERFVEKPDAETAERYIASGRYLWNPALFTFRADHLLELFRTHLPDHARSLDAIAASRDGNAVARAFQAMPSISIDYGLMEKLSGIIVIPAAFGWADVGHWRAVHDILADDPQSNVSSGMHIAVDSSGNLVVAPEGRVVATCGLRNHIIVDTPDALLVCSRDRAHGVREIVQELERRGLTAYL